MTSLYAPVARRGIVIQGRQVAAGDQFEGNGGVRREWWWQDGPVDSCCFCCTLRTGVGLLAVSNLLTGILVVFFMRILYVSGLELLLARYQRQFLSTCMQGANFELDCEQLNESIDQVKRIIKQFLAVFFVQGVLSGMAGVVGIWAVLFESARAAKVYLLSWPANFLLEMLTTLQLKWLLNKYHVQQGHGGTKSLASAVQTMVSIYYMKVSWSYYKARQDREIADSGGSSNVVSLEQATLGGHRNL